MVRLHPYQYTYFNDVAGTVRTADRRFMLDYWGLALKQASNVLREQIIARQEIPPANRKWKVAVCGPQRPAQVALGPDFSIGWDSHSADFAMTLGEFYCKGLPAPIRLHSGLALAPQRGTLGHHPLHVLDYKRRPIPGGVFIW